MPRPSGSRRPRAGAAANAGIGPDSRDAGVSSFHHGTLASVLERLRTDAAGLATSDAEKRLRAEGPNEIRDIAARSDLEILAGQLKSVPIALLAGSGALALTLSVSGFERARLDEQGVNFTVTRSPIGVRYGHGTWVL